MDNLKVPIELWNIYGQRHRTNNVVESWNLKLNSMSGRHHLNVFLLYKMLIEEAQEVSFQLMEKDLVEVRKTK